MATVLLSAAGAAIGGSIGGTALGLSMTAVGRFAGASLGRVIDQRIMGEGSDVVETGRVNRFRLTGSGEGSAVPQVFGRMRVPGHVIWATHFKETVTVSGGGKGGPPKPKTREYSYSVSLALALCEGVISHVGRIWADGVEIAPDDVTMRVYRGTHDQLPDPKMEAVEGAGMVPAYRGTAYVVMEDLDLSPFGNRVPQFTFEVCRPSQPGLSDANEDIANAVRAVAMLPGSGEYSLATTPVRFDFGAGQSQIINVNTPSGESDYQTSLDRLAGEVPGCGSVSLIVSWFGDDLRCGNCQIKPKVEQTDHDAAGMPWQVAGATRATADMTPRDGNDQPIYGGTPTDASVIEAIIATRDAGQEVMFYPFILMDQVEGNILPDPYSDAETQPVLPWRGRITLSQAPGRDASPETTAAADAEVAAFFGAATASDFTISNGGVTYTGPQDWGYHRFVLHNAALCAAAGGVEAFCIGSEMPGLTSIRGASGFPAVAALRALAAEVRTLLGPETKIGYAADWTEYAGFTSHEGNRYFHLDPLWADANIDYIGIDNYMPVSDWRDEEDHADADWGSIYNLDYLEANIAGGEGYDWYYHSPEARAAQIRTKIEDGEHQEPWIWRIKDIRNWWQYEHHDRINGVRQAAPTAWVPQSKPIWFTELGCAAIDKGTNQPNKFLDPKSSESAIPFHSNGFRDDFIQVQYLRAMHRYWGREDNNPQSSEYDGPMVDMNRAHVWAWDARPYPFFPGNSDLWSDGRNYTKGHWITGRASARTLASVVEEICHRADLTEIDVTGLYGVVRGYAIDDVIDARSALQPLMLAYGFDAVERDGLLVFAMRDGVADRDVHSETLVRDDEMDGVIERRRGAEAELSGKVRLRFIEADGDFDVLSEEAVLPDEATHSVAASEMPLSLTRSEGRQVVERWLSESRISRDGLKIALPPSRFDVGPGDVIRLDDENCGGLYRVDRIDQGAAQIAEAVRIEPGSYTPVEIDGDGPVMKQFTVAAPVLPLFMDLPLMTGEETPQAPHVAVTADPWPGSVALYASNTDSDYRLDQIVGARTTLGVLENAMGAACLGRVDRGGGVLVRLTSGALESISEEALLNGGNLAAIGDGSPENWELIQFRDAELVGENLYLISHRLRGQLGSDAIMPEFWAPGSYFVLLDGTPVQITHTLSQRDLSRNYRIGPASRGYDDPSYIEQSHAFQGIGLRPLSPTHLRAARQSNGDIRLDWFRRTRIGGDSWEGLDVPLGEEAEAYLVRVRDGSSVLREQQVSDRNWTYSSVDQSADDVTPSTEIEVAQVSSVFGAGVFKAVAMPPP